MAGIVEGAFVRVMFPTDERPRLPGLPHIGYCVAATSALAVLAHTTSKPWPAEVPLPFGVRVFEAEEARRLAQRPFVLDLRRLARLPLTRAWIPDMEAPDQGVVATAGSELRDELRRTVAEVMRRRRDLVRLAGPT